MIAGLALALGCTLATSVSVLLKQRGAVAARRQAAGALFGTPDIAIKHLVHQSAARRGSRRRLPRTRVTSANAH